MLLLQACEIKFSNKTFDKILSQKGSLILV